MSHRPGPTEPISFGPSALGVTGAVRLAVTVAIAAMAFAVAWPFSAPFAVVFLLIWRYVGAAFPLSLRLTAQGVETWTLGGRRRIAWSDFSDGLFWTDPRGAGDTLVPGLSSTGLTHRYGFAAKLPVDGATVRLRHGLAGYGCLAISEVRLAKGRQAIETICHYGGIRVPRDHETVWRAWLRWRPVGGCVGTLTTLLAVFLGPGFAVGFAMQEFPRYLARGDILSLYLVGAFLSALALAGLCVIVEVWLYITQAVRESAPRERAQ